MAFCPGNKSVLSKIYKVTQQFINVSGLNWIFSRSLPFDFDLPVALRIQEIEKSITKGNLIQNEGFVWQKYLNLIGFACVLSATMFFALVQCIIIMQLKAKTQQYEARFHTITDLIQQCSEKLDNRLPKNLDNRTSQAVQPDDTASVGSLTMDRNGQRRGKYTTKYVIN